MLLRDERKARWANNRDAAKACGLGASTVAKIENVETYPDYDPGIELVARYVAAMGLTLPDVLQRISSSSSRDSAGHFVSKKDALRDRDESLDNLAPLVESRGDLNVLTAPVRATNDDTLNRIRFALREAGTILFEAGIDEDVAGAGGLDSAPHPRTPGSPAHDHRLRQTPTRKRK